MEPRPIREWGWSIPPAEAILIAGPCSAETREQTRASCRGAAAQGAHILRAGIWKPRTRPGAFPGVGEIGLPWIVEAGQENKLPVTIEVAHARHVELALEAGVDMLWIGARSTANPFTVQEIADVLRGTDIPVFVKNPVNPDLDLWIGALERCWRAGIHRLAAIFRGFSVFKPGIYRNAPMWELPIELRRRFPSLDILVDPSHITGNRSLIQHVAQHGIDLAFDGFMIETHIDPENAWSDAAQQLTPEGLGETLRALVHRKPTVDDPEFLANLEALRYDIDQLDQEIIRLMSERMTVSREIGRYKRNNEVTILQMNRWANIFESRIQATVKAGLSDSFAREFIQAVHNESIRQQDDVMNQDEVPNAPAEPWAETGPSENGID